MSQPIFTGRVRSFDAERGLGTVVADSVHDSIHDVIDDGVLFHCIEITDGSRHIDIDAPVRFSVRLKLGRPEAFSVTKV